MTEFFYEKVFTAYNFGIFLGLYLVYRGIKFLWLCCIVVFSAIEDMTLSCFEKTRFREPLGLFFRKAGNLLTRLKWSDPKEDLYRDYYKTIDDIYNGTFK